LLAHIFDDKILKCLYSLRGWRSAIETSDRNLELQLFCDVARHSTFVSEAFHAISFNRGHFV
jgi:hypothetical protein